MHTRLLTLTFCLVAFFNVSPQDAGPYSYRAAPLLPILKALDEGKISGSLQFSGDWDPGRNPDFPQFNVLRTNSSSPIANLQRVLAALPSIHVTEDKNGMIRMVDPTVPIDVLNVRIAHIEFKGVYNPDDALVAILHTPELSSFIRARGFESPLRGGGIQGNPFGQWPPQQPHISGFLDNTTVSDVLDYVLKTFPGMWVYENRPESGARNRDVYFGFFRLKGTGRNAFVIE